MALVSTVGASTSNSYVSRTEANAYFAAGMHPKDATWTALSDNDKDEYLILATLHIDMENINGPKYDTTTTSGAPDQRLRFPRAQDYDSGTFIPLEVKLATYEQAINLAIAGATSTRTDLQAQGVTSVRMGDVSETYGGQPSGSMLCNTARQILLKAGLIKTAGAWA